MSITTRVIQAEAIRRLFPDFPSDLDSFVATTNPILAGFYNAQPACIVGIIPQRESGVAGIWSWNTPLVFEHPLLYAREVHRLIRRIHQLYPVIFGGCISSDHRWLTSLGATFNHDATLFRIEIPQ